MRRQLQMTKARKKKSMPIWHSGTWPPENVEIFLCMQQRVNASHVHPQLGDCLTTSVLSQLPRGKLCFMDTKYDFFIQEMLVGAQGRGGAPWAYATHSY